MLSENGYSMVCDPYETGSVPGFFLPEICADTVLCSHEHFDHNARGAVHECNGGAHPFKVKCVPSWHDQVNGRLRGPNIIHVIDSDYGIRVVHMGDIGEVLSDEQAGEIGRPDVLLIPVGGYFTVDAEEAKRIADRLKPRVIIPMHYRGDGFGLKDVDTVEPFLSLYDPNYIVRYGQSIEVDENTPPQVAVLTYGKK